MPIDWFTVAAQALNFLVLVWLMKRFLYRPILDAIDAREKRIATELAAAATTMDEARAERAEFKKKNEQLDQERELRPLPLLPLPAPALLGLLLPALPLAAFAGFPDLVGAGGTDWPRAAEPPLSACPASVDGLRADLVSSAAFCTEGLPLYAAGSAGSGCWAAAGVGVGT